MNFDEMFVCAIDGEHRNGWDLKLAAANYKNNKPARSGVQRSRKIHRIAKFRRPSPEPKHHTVVDAANFHDAEEAKLLIGNLHGRVTDSDIWTLFGGFASFKFCKVHYDKDGWPLGSAEVTYANKTDAVKAMELYKGLKLDGRVLNIMLIIPETYSVGSPSGSEFSSINDFEGPDCFPEQRALELEVNALFEEFVKSRRSRFTAASSKN